MSTINELNASTIRLLGSTQVITSVFSVVKELIENALDANASTVDVRLENYGLNKIEVRDNGCGIPSQNVPFVAKRYHTSKITTFSDIQTVATYGFRGEALGSLCTVATLSITTKTAEDDVSLTYIFNNQGQITSSHPSHLTQGTTITATDLFKNLPVRRQFYNNVKKKKDELKRVEDLLVAFSLILPKVRFTLIHDKERLWQKNGVADTRTALLGIVGKNVVTSLVHKEVELKDPKVRMDMFLPMPSSDVMVTSKSDNSRCICAVNNRPVCLKYIEKLIKQHYTSSLKTDGHRHPIYFLSIDMATDEIDVNVDPNKTIVLLHHKEEVLKALKAVLEELYGSISKSADQSTINEDSFSDSPKGDNTSDDSFTILSVTKKQPNIPLIKITTTDFSSNQSLPIPDITTTENILENQKVILDLNGMSADNLNTEDIQLTKLGKPVFQLTEDSLDDLINENKQNEDFYSSTKNSIVGGCLKEKDVTSLVVITPVQNESRCHEKVIFQSNPKLLEVYSDIVSTWNDSQLVLRTDVQNLESVVSDTEVPNPVSVELGGKNSNEAFAFTNQNINSNVLPVSIHNTSDGVEDSSKNQKEHDKSTKQAIVLNSDLWSKGKLLADSGDNIQPVTILHGKRLLSAADDEEPPQKKRHVIPQLEGQPTLSDIICSQPIKHPHTAFTVYSKEQREKVVSENPLADYDQVTSIIETSWQSLPDEEKVKYFHKTSPLTHKVKNVDTGSVKKERKLGKRIQEHSGKSSQSWTNIKDKLMKQKISAVPQEVKNLQFSLQSLKTLFTQKLFPSDSQKSSQICLIGPLKTSGVWLVYHENSIKIINPHRIQETVLYHNLLANHIIESEKLDQPLQLTESQLGDSLWTALKSLAEKFHSLTTYSVLQERRLTGNGIEITFHKEEANFSAKVTGISRCIPMYGIADVKEVLDLISSTNATTLAQTRPLKVLNYLQGEAVRMARKLPRQQSKDDMIELLIQMETVLPWKCEKCLHNKPFYHTLFNMNEFPCTQSQT